MMEAVSVQQLMEEIDQIKREKSLLKMENKKLSAKLDYFQDIFNESFDALIILDESLNVINVNHAACELLQIPEEALKQRNLGDFLVPHTESVKSYLETIKNEKQTKDIVLKLDTGILELSIEKYGFGMKDLYIMKDISSKKLLEREKNMNEKLFKDLFQRAADGIVIFDDKGQFVDANTSFCSLFEIQKNTISEWSLSDFIDRGSEWNLERLLSALQQNGKAKGELPVVLKQGQKKILEHTTTANMMNGYSMAIMRDVTEKRTMELKLFKSEERFREVFENAIDAIIIWDPMGNIQKANHAATRTFELPMEQLLKSNVLDFIDQDDARYTLVKREYIQSGAIREELLFIMANGQIKELEFTSKMNVMEGNHLTILRNVSDRKRMEKELRESEQKFRKIFSSGMDGIILFDNECNIVDANPMAIKILEIPEKRNRVYNLYELMPKEQTRLSGKMAHEVTLELQNGEEKILDFSVKRNINDNIHLAVFRDVTERKELEERLRKSDTLSVVGELAAGIAHEIRNPMTALKGFIQLLEASVKEDFSMYFNVITSELSRIESIITEFLVLAKPQAVHYEQKSVLKIMKDTMELLGAQSILSNVQMHLKTDPELPSIYCESNQLKQVFINIVKNAIEIMPGGGNVYIEIARKGKERLLISITDEGSGIPEDKIKRLGEPFYTTKERGTGLGLMVSFKIIEEHMGEVEVKSEAGKGTTFYITLPINKCTSKLR
ncbi:PAS domain S-box protein [Metabacillus sp. RGM 3146]|uniref:PAS domain S-box protein n=1 Tax=Metabacillus sp. RGM 3146 TaxID=3401092 RepID=UPI003B9C37EA